MKNRNENQHTTANTIQSLASLPGCAIDSKKAKESKMIKRRALVFERQTTGTFEIIF